MSDAFFLPLDGADPARGARFDGQVACTGPWSRASMHGGPPSALLVWACESVARSGSDPEPLAARTSVEFLSPVPVGEVEVHARVVRGGRTIVLAEATLHAAGRAVLQARTWLVRTAELPLPPQAPGPEPLALPGPQDCPPLADGWHFPYAEALEWRLATGTPTAPGDAATWVRQLIPLLPDREPSGLERAVLVADSGSGISAGLDWDRWLFVNVDLDVHLSRPLQGEWVLLDASSTYSTAGLGLARSVLGDEQGTVGTANQTLVVSPR